MSTQPKDSKKAVKQTKEELHTDEPLSEKDEVKKAEERLAKPQNRKSKG